MSPSTIPTIGALASVVICSLPLTGQVLLRDDFNDNSINPQLWSVVTAGIPGNPGVVERNQRMELISRGHLVTNAEFDPTRLRGLRIQGTWTVAQAPCHDYLHILTRSDGVPTAPFGETQHGIEFRANTEENACYIYTRSAMITLGTTTLTGTVSFRIGGTYAFDIRDGGDAVSFSMTDLATNAQWSISCRVLTDTTVVKHVVFHNRELVCGTNTAYLDDVVISGGDQAFYAPFGIGCPGTRGIPQLAARDLPRIGQPFSVSLTNLPLNSAGAFFFGWSRDLWFPITLPIGLAQIGMPGCQLLVSGEVLYAFPTGKTGEYVWQPQSGRIPADPSLVGFQFFNQAFVIDLGANAASLIATNGGHGIIG